MFGVNLTSPVFPNREIAEIEIVQNFGDIEQYGSLIFFFFFLNKKFCRGYKSIQFQSEQTYISSDSYDI